MVGAEGPPLGGRLKPRTARPRRRRGRPQKNLIQNILFWFMMYWIFCFMVIFLSGSVWGQEALSKLEAKDLWHGHWQYRYSSKASNQVVVHRADTAQRLVWYFGFGNKLKIFENGEEREEAWDLKAGILTCRFGDIELWRVTAYGGEQLRLSYQSPLDSAWYHYHFERLAEAESPISLGPAWLPTLKIVHQEQAKEPRYPHRFVRAERGKRGSKRPSLEPQPLKIEPIFIQIEMVGGGYFGGPDPIYRNSLVIKNDGSVLRQTKSELQGLREYRGKISRKTLEELMLYIERQQFFDLDQGYHCRTEDCLKRMRQTPRPVAFRLAITYGERRKVVAVSIWEGPAGLPWVDYPPELNDIVRAIEKVGLQ